MQNSNETNRKIRAKMDVALKDYTGTLSVEMRNILLDDLVCAFENRLKVLATVESNVNFIVDLEGIKASKSTL